MRTLTGHQVNECNSALEIQVLDEPGSGGAHHHYAIIYKPDAGTDYVNSLGFHYSIDFQNGPVKEVGTNGLTHESLLAILIDRLQCFQAGPFKCDENEAALLALESAQAILHRRTLKRVARNVEGTHTV